MIVTVHEDRPPNIEKWPEGCGYIRVEPEGSPDDAILYPVSAAALGDPEAIEYFTHLAESRALSSWGAMISSDAAMRQDGTT